MRDSFYLFGILVETLAKHDTPKNFNIHMPKNRLFGAFQAALRPA
jgi:hypothetical protein